jgi:hypothetical protein
VTRAAVERDANLCSSASDAVVPSTPPPALRLANLEEQVATLRAELTEVQQQLAAFRKQFE